MAQPIGPSETEIKLVGSAAMLEQLRAHPVLAGPDEVTLLVTTYFDTRDSRLRRGGASLRIRTDAKGREQTLKLKSSGGSSACRREWNAAISGTSPEPGAFPADARGALLHLLQGAPLVPVATTRIERTARRVHHRASTIEIAFDVGTIEAGERRADVRELEIELLEGQFEDIAALALELPLGPELSWSLRSKAERCHALAHGLQPAATRAEVVKLLPAMTAADGFKMIAWNCLDQLLRNYPLVVASGDAESLHQSRVAIRRLRAAFSLFGAIVDDEAASVLRAELSAVARGLGPARDLQVLLGRIASTVESRQHQIDELEAHLGTKRDAAVKSAQTLLESGPFQRLLLELARWIEHGEWLSRKAARSRDRRLEHFARHVLSRKRRKLRLDERLASLPQPVRHRLRIDAKKLRYACEFFASLYDDRTIAPQREAFGKALEKLQDSLGELNDLFIAAAAPDVLFGDLEPIAAARLGAQFTALLETQRRSEHKLLRQAERSLDRVAAASAWWKAA